jgi:hypothetical protein
MEQRVIHVLTNSIHPPIHPEGKALDYSRYTGLWHFRLAQRLQAASDEYAQECWAIDSRLSEEVEWERDGISVRVFPSTSLRYVGDYSSDLLRTLKAESRRQGAIIVFHGLFSYSTLLSPLLLKRVPMVVQHHGGLRCCSKASTRPGQPSNSALSRCTYCLGTGFSKERRDLIGFSF